MSFKKKSSKKSSFKNEKDEWSDDENEELKYKNMVGRPDDKKVILTEDDVEQRLLTIDQEYLVDADYKIKDYTRRSKFSGDVKLEDKTTELSPSKVPAVPSRRLDFEIDRPDVHFQTEKKLGNTALDCLWQQFLNFGSDESELLEIKHIPKVFSNLYGALGHKLPYEQIGILKKMDPDDFIEYSQIANDLADVTNDKLSSQLLGTYSPPEPPIPTDINNLTKQLDKYNDDNSNADGNQDGEDAEGIDDQFDPGELYRLKVVYSTYFNELRGKVRIKHVIEIMDQLGYTRDQTKLSKTFWDNHKEYVFDNVDELKNIILEIKVQVIEVLDPLAHLFHYPLPAWLQKEFKASEILLYQHHFHMTDKDGGGEVDSEELQFLLEQFGTNVSLEEAQDILDEFDMDGGGTMDFLEFMVLIYRMQKGTINVSNNKLAQAVVEVKSQLRIFEEIEIVQRNPPPYCKVLNFGGAVVTCDFLITGPENTPYEGGKFVLKMTILDGYPYNVPEVKFLTRVYHINLINMLDGTSRFPGFRDDIWDSSWTMKKLLVYAVDYFKMPQLARLPAQMEDIFDAWQKEAMKLINTAEKRNGGGSITIAVKDPNDLHNALSLAIDVLHPPVQQVTAGVVDRRQQATAAPAPAVTMATLTNTEETKRLVRSLTRVEQAHLQVLFQYLADRPTYNRLIKQFIQTFNFKGDDEEAGDEGAEGEEVPLHK